MYKIFNKVVNNISDEKIKETKLKVQKNKINNISEKLNLNSKIGLYSIIIKENIEGYNTLL